MKVGLVIPVIRCDMCTMRTCVFTCGNGRSWAAVCFLLHWPDLRTEGMLGVEKQKSIAFGSYALPARGAFIKRRQRVCFYITPLSCDAGGRGELILFGPLFRETQFCLQMQFNEFWMLLGDWAAVNVGAVHSLDAGLSMFGRNVTVLIQRFWHKLIPLSAAKADSESLH